MSGRTRFRPLVAVVVCAAVAGFVGAAPGIPAPVAGAWHQDLTFVAVTEDNRLLTFSAEVPEAPSSRPVVGLQPGETLVGIDVRPATGELFGVGSHHRLYALDDATGAASGFGSGAFSPSLAGTAFGVAFDWTTDRIRVVSNEGQNLRLDPSTGASVATDAPPAYRPGTAAAGGGHPAVTGLAQTPTADGRVYVLDTGHDLLAVLDPPDRGVLHPVGSLRIGAGAVNGFAVAATADGPVGFAALTAGGATRLYAVDLATGALRDRGAIGTGSEPLAGLAVLSEDRYRAART